MNKTVGLALSAVCCLLLSGCRGLGSGSPNQRAVAQMLAFDAAESGVRLTVRILDEEGQPGGYATVEQEGETVTDALSEIGRRLGKEVFLRDTRLVLLGEELCESGIGDYQNYLVQSFQIRPRVSVAAAQGEAGAFLQPDASGNAPVDEIAPILQWSGKEPGEGITVMELERSVKASGGDGTLPTLSLDEQGDAMVDGLLVLHQQKASRRLGREAADKLGLLMMKAEKQTLSVNLDEGKATVELLSCRGRVAAKITAEEIPGFTVSRQYSFRLLEWSGSGVPEASRLEQALNAQLQQYLEEAVRLAVFDVGADLIQLDSALRKDQPVWWRERGEDWMAQRENSVFYLDVRCQVEIRQP